MAVSRAIIVGNLTRDPELRHTPSGMAVCSLSVAVNDRVKKNGVWEDYVSYFDVTAFGNQGENCAQYLSKGSPVGVDGKLRQERWEKDGQKHSRVKIIADSVQFLPSARGGGSGGSRDEGGNQFVPAGQASSADDADFAGSDDDIPF